MMKLSMNFKQTVVNEAMLSYPHTYEYLGYLPVDQNRIFVWLMERDGNDIKIHKQKYERGRTFGVWVYEIGSDVIIDKMLRR